MGGGPVGRTHPHPVPRAAAAAAPSPSRVPGQLQPFLVSYLLASANAFFESSEGRTVASLQSCSPCGVVSVFMF